MGVPGYHDSGPRMVAARGDVTNLKVRRPKSLPLEPDDLKLTLPR